MSYQRREAEAWLNAELAFAECHVADRAAADAWNNFSNAQKTWNDARTAANAAQKAATDAADEWRAVVAAEKVGG